MKEGVFLVTILASFILIPFLPSEILMLSDFVLVRLALLFIFLIAMNFSPLVGILTLACIGFLFIERNKKKMMGLQRSMQLSSPDSEAIRSITTPDTAPEQPPYEVPSQKNIPFAPNAESGDNGFVPVAETINSKVALPTESSDGAKFAIRQSFGWVNTDLIQE
jgi:hypothetical protein